MGEPWFGPKDYGVGLAPKSRAGWISLVVFVVAVAAMGGVASLLALPPWIRLGATGLLTLAYLALILIKSDRQPWRWRWGGQ